jgi:hypothetical protein
VHLVGQNLAIHPETSPGLGIVPIYILASSSEDLGDLRNKAELLRVFSVPAGRTSSSLGVWHCRGPRSHPVIHVW